jgi:hypothetical protein
MAATVSTIFGVCAHVCYPSFSDFTGSASAILGTLTACFVVRGKCWPFAFSVFCVCFNTWFLYPALPLHCVCRAAEVQYEFIALCFSRPCFLLSCFERGWR